MTEPPEDTRAYFRGRCLAKYAAEVVAASWDSVIFDVGRESLVRVPMMEPERGTKVHVGALFDQCPSAKDLLEALTGRLTGRRRPARDAPDRQAGRGAGLSLAREVGSSDMAIRGGGSNGYPGYRRAVAVRQVPARRGDRRGRRPRPTPR